MGQHAGKQVLPRELARTKTRSGLLHSPTENAEGVIARNVAVVESGRRRSRRVTARATLISLSREETQRLEDMPSLDSM